MDRAPMLLPLEGSTSRRSLEQWFDAEGIRPRAIAEFQDSALLKAFGDAGVGLFAVPTAVEKDVLRSRGVSIVGRTDAVVERFYAISVERKLKHPAVVAISETARQMLFGATPGRNRAAG